MRKRTRTLSFFLCLIMMISLMPAPKARAADDAVRYTVLVLDTSDVSVFLDANKNPLYTADTAINYVKKAAKTFTKCIQEADGTNYVAVVSYRGESASVVCPFSQDIDQLNQSIDSLRSSEKIRSVGAGLESAYNLIQSVDENSAKNVVLFTTGFTNGGGYSYDGLYDDNTVGSIWTRRDTEVRIYAYANRAIAVADQIKSIATLYSIGLFQVMEQMPEMGKQLVEFLKLFAKDCASSPNEFYDVKDPEDLELVFGKVAENVENPDETPDPYDPASNPKGQKYAMLDHTYSFKNPMTAISQRVRDLVYPPLRAWKEPFHKALGLTGTKGQCFGMAVSAAASAVYQSPPEKSYQSGSQTADILYDIGSDWVSTETDLSALDYISCAFLTQLTAKRFVEKNLNHVDAYYSDAESIFNIKRFEKFVKAIESYQKTKEHPVIIDFYNHTEDHAVLALGILSKSNEKVEVAIYDSNYPGENMVMTFYTDEDGRFTHLEYRSFSKSEKKWESYTRKDFYFETNAVENFIEAWENQFEDAFDDPNYDHLLTTDSRILKVKTQDGNLVTLTPDWMDERLEYIPIQISSGAEDDPNAEIYDLYYVSKEGLSFSVPSTEEAVHVSYATKNNGVDLTIPGSSTAVVTVPDNENMSADIQSSKSDAFSVSYYQMTADDQLQTITLSGDSESIQTAFTDDGIEVRSEDLSTVEIDLSKEDTDLDHSVVRVTGDRFLITFDDDEVAVMEDLNGDGKYETPAHEIGASLFTDIKQDAYYYTPVLWAVNTDPAVTLGVDETHFAPENTCTREQVVTFLWRAMGCPEPKSANNPFTDVKEGAYYYKAVLWAVENGITNGTGAKTFSPELPCTRAHVVTFLWRTAKMPAAGSGNPFRDVPAGQYYTDAVLWAVNHNPQITNGTGADTFSPDDPCTRGQIVTFLYRYMK